MRTTRADVANLTDVLPEQAYDAWLHLKGLAYAVCVTVVAVVLIPVLKLWLPELGESERAARELQRKRWADEDI